MLLPEIKLEDNKYITNIYNTVTKETTSFEFEDLRKASDYTLEVQEKYYNIEFYSEIFALNYAKYETLFEYNSNPSEELLNKLRAYQDYFKRLMTQEGYYSHMYSQDDPDLWNELFGGAEEELEYHSDYKTFNDYRNSND